MADEVVRAEIVAEDKTGPGIASAKRNLAGLQRELNSGRSGFAGFAAASSSASSAISTFAAGAAGVGLVVGAMGLGALASGLIGVGRGALASYVEFERLGTSLNALAAKEALLSGQASTMQQALAQTADSSKELLGWIQKLAIESPFKQNDVAQAFRLSMAMGFSTREAQRLTTAMINFATATGAEGYSMERIARALGQINTKGKLSLEEVNQLTEAGVDVMRILGEATGKTGKELSDSISKGAVDAGVAIEAILSDTERLYSGAAKASATSMGGIVSSLEEMGELSSRNFFTGMFKEVQPYLAATLAILSAPEFQAGISAWGDKLGSFTADGLQGAADALERIDAAIMPLLDKGAPPWLVGLQGLAAAGGTPFVVDIKPKITTLETPDGGLKIEVEPYATTITSADGGMLKVDVAAGRIAMDADTTDEIGPVNLVADWKEGTIGSLIAAAQVTTDAQQMAILLEAGWQPDAAAILQADAAAILQAALNVNEWAAQISTYANPASLAAMGDEIVNYDWAAVVIPGVWEEGVPETLRDTLQGYLTGFKIAADWAGSALSGLWNGIQGFFTAHPVKIATQGYYNPTTSYTPDTTPQGWDSGFKAPIDINPPMPEYQGDPRYRAIGDGFFRGGLAMVGEGGPELVVLPRGAQIYNNRDTRALAGVPHFAEGTTALPPALRNLLTSLGLWVPQTPSGTMYGPKTRDQAAGWQDFTRKGEQAMQSAADTTAAAFEDAAKKTSRAFEGALDGVPGLFGTSQVTADQMRLAEAGIPQNFADDWRRQLNDEVLNGVEWGDNVDIKDAARRAGIDPNLPNDIILELVNQAWSNGSFFANPANLSLINTDAVKASMEQQQKEMQGKSNIMGLFGITDENMQSQIDALGGDIAAMFGGAAETDAVKGAGAAVFSAMTGGFSDSNTAVTGVAGMATALQSAAGTPENQQLLYDGGASAYGTWLKGWKAAASEAPTVPPSGSAPVTTGPPIGPPLPPGRAVGTGYWYGGWMTVHANETIYAPRGTAVRTAGESAQAGGATVINNYVTVNRAIDEEAFLARMARRLQRGH